MGSKPIFRSERLGKLRLGKPVSVVPEAAHLGDGLTPVEVRILPPPLSHLRLKPPQGFHESSIRIVLGNLCYGLQE